jgi:hypothetical protein
VDIRVFQNFSVDLPKQANGCQWVPMAGGHEVPLLSRKAMPALDENDKHRNNASTTVASGHGPIGMLWMESS